MMFKVRESYGTLLHHNGQKIPAWPRPHQLVKAEPLDIRKLGPTKRKGEFIIGFAEDLLAGEQDLNFLENCDPETFYSTISKVRGIGPTSAQQLMLSRGRTDAVFPSNKTKGKEKGLRKWVIMSYGGDPNDILEEEFQQLIANWNGYEAAALEFLFMSYVLGEKERKAKNEQG